MKAIVITRFGGPEVLACQTIENPTPGPGQVLIRVRFASVNFADVKARQGAYHLSRKPPFIPGLDLYGTIAALGPGSDHLRIGQRVVAFPLGGSYAELAVADARLTFPVPEAIDDLTAAAFPVAGGAAYGMLSRAARLQPGERVLIHSVGGGVGGIAAQLSKALGASMVAGTVGRTDKVEKAQMYGADQVFVRSSPTFHETIKEAFQESGPDVVLSALGGPALEDDLVLLAPFGRLIVYGGTPGRPTAVDANALYGPNKSMIGFSFGTIRRSRPELASTFMNGMIDLISSGRVRMFVEKRLPLESAGEAHAWIESGTSTGKTLLEIDS
jgi:NADPH2:quinone reductase